MEIGTMQASFLPTIKQVEQFGEFGFDFVELAIEGPQATPQRLLEQKREIQNVLSKYDMKLLGHSPKFTHTQREFRCSENNFQKLIRESLEIAREFEISFVTVHEPSKLWALKLRDKNFTKQIRVLKDLTKIGEDLGIQISVENTDNPLVGLSEFKKIFTEIPEIKATLDVGHAHLFGGTDGVLEWLDLFKDNLIHIHLSDNLGKEDQHMGVGEGNVDWEKLIPEIKKVHNKTISLEIHSGLDNLNSSKALLRKWWNRM